MPLYQVRLKTKKGVAELDIEARTQEEASRLAAKSGGYVLEIKQVRSWRIRLGMTPDERQTFLQRLAAMLASRVGTGEALALMRDTFGGRIKTVAGDMLRAVEGGADIGGAMEILGPRHFPETTIALIKAGSRGGSTAKSLRDAAVFELEMHSIRRSANKGMFGAIGGFAAAAATTWASLYWVGPMISGSGLVTNGKGVDINWVHELGKWLGYFMVVSTVLLSSLGLLGTVGKRIHPTLADAIIRRIPFYKDLVLARNNYITLYGLSLLISSGVRIEEALRLSLETTQRGALKNDLAAAIAAVKAGKSWAMAMTTLHPTDKAALASSLDREQVASSLDALAKQYRELYGQRVSSFVPALNLIAALCLTISGGVLFGETILPMLQVTSGMLK